MLQCNKISFFGVCYKFVSVLQQNSPIYFYPLGQHDEKKNDQKKSSRVPF